MERIISIDIAKAICIILVVIGHYVPDNSPDWYVALHDIIYTFHMPLFMFASGYVYIATKKDRTYGNFLIKKIRRLMVPYFATSFIVISIKLLTQGSMSVDSPVNMWSYLRMFYLPEAGAFLWFIWALWWMFVVVELLKSKSSRTFLFVLALVIHYIPMNSLPELFCIAQFKRMILFFMLGIFVYEHDVINKFVVNYNPYKVFLSTLLFAGGLCWHLNWGGIEAVLPFTGIFFILEISAMVANTRPLAKRAWLMSVAASSYIIYLFHTTFEGLAKSIIRRLPFDSASEPVFILGAFVVIMAGILVPILLDRCVFRRYVVTRVLFGYNRRKG